MGASTVVHQVDLEERWRDNPHGHCRYLLRGAVSKRAKGRNMAALRMYWDLFMAMIVNGIFLVYNLIKYLIPGPFEKVN